MLLSDAEIIKRCYDESGRVFPNIMISPFVASQVRTANGISIVSYGLSAYGYDVRLSNCFKMMKTLSSHGRSLLSVPIDPLVSNDDDYVDVYADEDDAIIIPPGGFLLGITLEYFNIPRDVLVECLGKSTLARIGLNVTVTPLEPEWCGRVVLELSNIGTRPIKLYAYQGIAQFIFHHNPNGCNVSYKDRNGKYQNQNEIITAKV